MSYGTVIEMFNLENRNRVTSKPTLNIRVNYESITGHRSTKVIYPTDCNMCLHEPMVVLDKNVVTQYFKTRRMPNNLLSRQTDKSSISYHKNIKLERKNQVLVKVKKCIDRTRNRLSVNEDLINRNMPIKEKEVILEGPMFNENKNLLGNINEYIAPQSTDMLSAPNLTNTQILDNCTYKAYACNNSDSVDYHNFLNNTSTVSIEGKSVQMECGDGILFTHGTGHYDENIPATNAESVEMECGDDILFTEDAGHYDDNIATKIAEDDEMECGDDILFTEGAGYYNTDEDSIEGNQELSYIYEDAQAILDYQIKQKINIQNIKSTIKDTFKKQEHELYQCDECHYKTFNIKELHSHVAIHQSDFSNNKDDFVISKCDGKFETLSSLKNDHLEAQGLKYFYTCKFCPSTSWYSSTLKNHIETVHSGELDKENIDEIMQNIKLLKQADNDQLYCTSHTKTIVKKEQVLSVQVIKKPTKKLNKKRFICYTEAKQLLKVFCSECNAVPQTTRKKIMQYCSQCYNEFTYQCRKCGNYYLTYSTAWKHAKWSNCDKIKMPTTSSKRSKKIHATKKFYNAYCTKCNELFERKERNVMEVCLKCKTCLEYQCVVCLTFFKREASAQRHTQVCHKKWRNNIINASLATFALNDHNYYHKDKTETNINEVRKIVQPPVTELKYQHQAVRKVYLAKRSHGGSF